MSDSDHAASNVLTTLGREVQNRYVATKRVLSFSEYIELVRADPLRHLRSAAQYLIG